MSSTRKQRERGSSQRLQDGESFPSMPEHQETSIRQNIMSGPPRNDSMPVTETIPTFNKHGAALSEDEREQYAKKRGLCVRCGIKVAEVKGFFKKVPLTTEHVYNGICIKCDPDQVPRELYLEWETKFRTSAVSPSKATFKAAAFAARVTTSLARGGGGSSSDHDAGAQPSLQMADSQRMDGSDVSFRMGAAAQHPMRNGGSYICVAHSFSERPMENSVSAFRNTRLSLSEHSQHTLPDSMTNSFGESRRQWSNPMNAESTTKMSNRPQQTASMDLSSIRENQGQPPPNQLDGHQSQPKDFQYSPYEASDKSMPNPSREERPGRRDLFQSGDTMSSSWQNYDHQVSLHLEVEDYSAKDTTDTIDQVMTAIKENRNKPDVLKEMLYRLRNIASEDEGDAVSAIRDVLNEYRSGAKVLTAAAGALWSVTAIDDKKKLDAARCGAIDCLLDSLRNSQTQQDPEFDEWAIGSLACLARGKHNRAHIGNANGVETILDTLRLHQVSAGVFEWSCRALHTLVYQYKEEKDSDKAIRRNIAAIEENEGVSVIVCAMKMHYSESVAQGWAMKLLLRLMDTGDEAAANQVLSQINKEDGIIACVKVLKARSTTPDVLGLAAELLSNLLVEAQAAKSSNGVQTAAESIPTVVRLIKEHDNSKSLQVSLCRLLSKLALNSKGRTEIKETKAIGDMVYIMMKYTDKLAFHEAASWTLWTMSSYPNMFNFSYVKDALGALDMSTKEFPESPFLMAGACGFIANVSSANEANVSDIPTDIPMRGLRMSDRVDMVEEQACRALTCILSRKSSRISKLFEGDGVQVLVKHLHSVSPKASLAACKLLTAMADTNDKNKKAMLDDGCADAVLALIRKSSSGLREALELVIAVLSLEQKKSVHLPGDSIQVILDKLRSDCSNTPDLIATACSALVNLLLTTTTGSTTLNLEGLVESMTGLIDSRSSPVEVKEMACTVLWALGMKRRTQSADDLSRIFYSIIKLMRMYNGEDQPFNSALQSAAAGTLACISGYFQDNPIQLGPEDIDSVIAVMYVAMECDRDRKELQENLLKAMLNLSLADDSLVIRTGGVVVVIDVMVEYELDEAIQEIGLTILAALASTENLQVNLCIVETGGLDMIISGLAAFSSNQKVQVAACKALSHLSVDNECRELIASQGGLMLVVSTINTNNENTDILDGACATLLNLSSDTNEEALADAKVIETVIEVLRHNPDSAGIQGKGLGVLQNLSMRSSAAKKEIAELGGIKILVDAMHEFMGSPEVLSRAFTTMWSLALLDSNQKAIAKAGGVQLLLNGMMAQIDSAEVQKQACGCLCTLSSASQNNSMIRDADGVDVIVFSMWAHYKSADVLSEACRALASVAVDTHTNQVIIAHDGEINAIIAAMRRFPKKAKLQENACVALRNLLLSPDSVESVRFLADDIRSVMMEAATRYDGRCSDCANQVLQQL